MSSSRVQSFIFSELFTNFLAKIPILGAKKALVRKLAAISGPLALRPHLSKGLPLSLALIIGTSIELIL